MWHLCKQGSQPYCMPHTALAHKVYGLCKGLCKWHLFYIVSYTFCSLWTSAGMVTIVEKTKSECTTLDKMLVFHAEIIAVAYCIAALGQLKKKERKEKKYRVLTLTGLLFSKLWYHHLHHLFSTWRARLIHEVTRSLASMWVPKCTLAMFIRGSQQPNWVNNQTGSITNPS